MAASYRVPRPSSRRLLIELIGIGGFYAIVVAYFSIRIDGFLGADTAETILAGATVLGLVAVGQTFAIISGGFDLSVGGMVPLGAVLYGELLNSSGIGLALLLTVAAGVAVGLVNGVIVARMKINALIGTLAMLSVTGGVAFIVADGQTIPLTGAHAGLWGDPALLGLQTGTVAFVVVAVLATLVLRYTTYGRTVYTIGGNREAALLAGLNVDAVSVSVYALSGACAAFGGAVAASQLLASSPTIGTDTTLNSIAAVVLGGASLAGGVGGVPGTVLGVLLLGTTTVGLGLLQVASFYQTIVTGLVLLLAVMFGRLREVLLARSQRLGSQ
jgi:ribose transport system permease protein